MNWELEIKNYAHAQNAAELLMDLCQIPAPLGGEGRRAVFCLDWLHQNGVPQAALDEVGNVVCLFPGKTRDMTAFLAHLDVVFPDESSLPMVLEGERLHCPGVGDNTANLINLLLCAAFLAQKRPTLNRDLLLVCNVGEEGLGNLRGTRAIFDIYGNRIRRCYSFDSFDLHRMATTAVGSHRYYLKTTAPGGHSWFDFGGRNAIADLAALIAALDAQPLPREARTSYNFGVVTGGTSVNTIAQDAAVQYEYRSADYGCLMQMQTQLDQIVKRLKNEGLPIQVEDIGKRPAAKGLDEAAQAALVSQTAAIIRRVTGREAECYESSTDCNIPLSLGIPAVTVGTVHAAGMHTRQEWVDLTSLPKGLELALHLIAAECQ